ncbi:MAG: hypothetical protein OEZ24_04450, partial [Candidatus Bathyarchaeota archaeon]|nr:hypothetical protein [Candidatus Bathyarchaeota archaeon]
LELAKDFKVCLNLTLELSHKVKMNALPYMLLWAEARSDRIEQHLQGLTNEDRPLNVEELVRAVLETKAVENTLMIVKELAEKARHEISSLRDSDSRGLLLCFAEAQHRILTESLNGLQH